MILSLTLQRLRRWPVLLASWQAGRSRRVIDPEFDAIRDHRERTLMLRAEVNALVTVLTDRGVLTEAGWAETVEAEARHLCDGLERAYPGVHSTADGLHFDMAAIQAAGWMRFWKMSEAEEKMDADGPGGGR